MFFEKHFFIFSLIVISVLFIKVLVFIYFLHYLMTIKTCKYVLTTKYLNRNFYRFLIFYHPNNFDVLMCSYKTFWIDEKFNFWFLNWWLQFKDYVYRTIVDFLFVIKLYTHHVSALIYYINLHNKTCHRLLSCVKFKSL